MAARPLTNQTALVTGASSGLGLRFAHILSAAGARVALAARRTDRLELAAEAIRSAGGEAVAIELDVTRSEAIGPAIDQVEASLGPRRLSILINNAGVAGDGAALSLPFDRFNQAFDVNVRGVFFTAREAAKRMLDSGVAESGSARIVNIASIAGLTQLPGSPHTAPRRRRSFP